MALTWNAEKVVDLEQKRKDDPGMLDCLIWASLGICKEHQMFLINGDAQNCL